jgi:hypothetical protein
LCKIAYSFAIFAWQHAGLGRCVDCAEAQPAKVASFAGANEPDVRKMAAGQFFQ